MYVCMYVEWRNESREIKPYLWKGGNYLIKIQYDLDFLSSIHALFDYFKIFDGNILKRNPFLMCSSLNSWSMTGNNDLITLLVKKDNILGKKDNMDLLDRVKTAAITLINENPTNNNDKKNKLFAPTNQLLSSMKQSAWVKDAKKQIVEISENLAQDSLELREDFKLVTSSIQLSTGCTAAQNSNLLKNPTSYTLNTYLSSPIPSNRSSTGYYYYYYYYVCSM